MTEAIEYVLPGDIEKRSFEIIRQELGDRRFPEEQQPIIYRCIHTTADLDFADTLCFSDDVIKRALDVIKKGCTFVTDSNMTRTGINKAALARHGCECLCFMADPDIASRAAAEGTTRAAASVDKAAEIRSPIIYAVGNAPTALLRLCEHIKAGTFLPELVIGVPVGFVNVVQSKEMLIESGIPYITARGRKGGSTVAAAICNALLYMSDEKSPKS